MSGRATTRRSTNGSRLLLVFALVTAIALPSLAGRVGLSSALDADRAVSAATSKVFDDTSAIASTIRAERPLLVALVMSVLLLGAPARRRRRPVMEPARVPSSALVLGGVGLRAPPASSRA